MPAAGTSAIALHVEAAKRLLDELEQHADSALRALGDEDGSEFLAAVHERDRVLAELNDVVEALAHERVVESDPTASEDSELLAEMAQAASEALESHEHLMARTQAERDRLAAALDRAKRPDTIAHQYAVATAAQRRTTLSVTG
jgi:DNA repair ATPase RecN